MVKNLFNMGDLGSIPGLGRFPWKRERLPTPVFWPGEFHGLCSLWGHKESDVTFTFQQKSTALGLRWWSSDFHWKSFHWKNLSSNAGDVGLIPGLGRFPWKREMLPTSVCWPEKFHGLYSPWGHKELDKTYSLEGKL